MPGTVTRRALLIGSAAIVGGVAFGVYELGKPVDNPLIPGPGEVTLNPYVLITDTGVTIVTPRAEMGQGVQTTLAALVAEELDMDWADIRAIHGPAASAYFNGAVIAAGLPFAEYRDSRTKEIATAAAGVAARVMGMQVTGGSTSIRDGYDKMRLAGAAARHVLIAAAAARLDLPADRLKTRGGAVIAPDGTALRYADLAADAALIDPPATPALKSPADWVLLGKPLPRLDMVPKVTGTAEFGIDVRPDGMLHAAVRMNPRLGGGLHSYHAETARTMPGVQRIIDLGTGVAVVADNTWRAFQALDTIRFDWGPAPYPADTAGIFDEIAGAFDSRPNSTLRDDGDVANALQGDDVIEAEYRLPYLAHSTMEPMNAVALFKGGHMTIWAGNQAPTLIRDAAARAADLRPDDVTVHTPYLGGGFGRRAEYDVTDLAARIAKELPGTPVQLTYSREEDMRHDFYRPGVIARAAGKPGADGPAALSVDLAAASAYRMQGKRAAGMTPPGADKLLVEGLFDQPYGVPHFRVRGYISDVAVPVGSWRSVGNSSNCFVMESFLDELAHAGGQDPVAMRLALLAGQSAKAAKVLETVADMADWGSPLLTGTARGVAFSYSFGSPTAQIVQVSDSPAGLRIDRIWCAQDVGLALDPRNIEAQIVSGITYGLSAAISGEITFADGAVVEDNFDSYDAVRMDRMPPVDTRILASGGAPGGVGEPATPPIAPALANAIFSLTGKRIRHLPLHHAVDFA
ncbi:xanthine dehydrogenase family protein molybdopterin-binding subunit [Actibacterium sp. D379-3]